MEVINIKNAEFSYGEKVILNKINLEISKGEVVCLVGPNGCGKTTLLDCILGINKLNSGEIYIGNYLLDNLKVQDIALYISYVPQKKNASFPYKVKDMVLMGRAAYTNLFKVPGDEDENIVEEAMVSLGIDKYKEELFTNLSGGESQLVMIARALAQNTQIIVMDEPTSSLDFKNEIVLLENIANLVKHKNISVIMATHVPNHAFYLESQGIKTSVAMLSNGKIRYYGKPLEVLTENNIREVYGIEAKVINYPIKNKIENIIIPLGTKKGEVI